MLYYIIGYIRMCYCINGPFYIRNIVIKHFLCGKCSLMYVCDRQASLPIETKLE